MHDLSSAEEQVILLESIERLLTDIRDLLSARSDRPQIEASAHNGQVNYVIRAPVDAIATKPIRP